MAPRCSSPWGSSPCGDGAFWAPRHCFHIPPRGWEQRRNPLPSPPSHFLIHFTNSHAEALSLTEAGWEPIECAFGSHGSVLGPLAMDHHGTESHRRGVAIRACGSDYGARIEDPRFVVTGTPDADATLAIIALAGRVSKESIPAGFPELVDRHDTAPIGLDLMTEEHGPLLLAFQQSSLPRGQRGFERAVERMTALLLEGLDAEELRRALGAERARKERAASALLALYEPGGFELPISSVEPCDVHDTPSRVALVSSVVWGFDIWYRWAPVVVSHSERLQKVTIGCTDAARAAEIFGEGGLLRVFSRLGPGWGGRAAVGGSPRGVPMTLDEGREVARLVAELLGGSPEREDQAPR